MCLQCALYENFTTKMIKFSLLAVVENTYRCSINSFTSLGFLNLSKEIANADSWVSLPEVLILWVLWGDLESSFLLALQRVMGQMAHSKLG